MSLCEWDPDRGGPALTWPCSGLRTGCSNEAVVALGHNGAWHVCATCAELPRFRRLRVGRVLGRRVELRRDSAGWWVDGLDFPDRPAPLAEVLGRFPCKKESAP